MLVAVVAVQAEIMLVLLVQAVAVLVVHHQFQFWPKQEQQTLAQVVVVQVIMDLLALVVLAVLV
jgi:hypothetical protein